MPAPDRGEWIAVAAFAVALAALAFPSGSHRAVVVAVVVAGLLLIAATVATARSAWPGLRRRYQQAVERDRRRTAEARGDPLQSIGVGGSVLWDMPDGSQVGYMASLPRYKRAVEAGLVDPSTTFFGEGPPLPPMPATWLGRWRVRRGVRRGRG